MFSSVFVMFPDGTCNTESSYGHGMITEGGKLVYRALVNFKVNGVFLKTVCIGPRIPPTIFIFETVTVVESSNKCGDVAIIKLVQKLTNAGRIMACMHIP